MSIEVCVVIFVKPTDIRRHSKDLTKLPFMDESLHFPNEDLFVGDSTRALLIHLTDDEDGSVNNFLSEVVSYFMSFVKKQLKCFDFSSDIFSYSFLSRPTSLSGYTSVNF